MSSPTGIEHPRSVIFDEFLVWPECHALMQFANRNEARFRASQVVSVAARSDGSDPAYRRSRVSLALGPFGELIAARIRSYFPQILRALRLDPFEIRRIEAQLTASNDGDFFKVHNDDTHADAPSRRISFVYYFHREPKPFRGGELVLHDRRLDNGYPVAAGVRRTILPQQNDIVFFPCSCLHEVRPVVCPTHAFRDSRFTLNGWIHA